MNMINHELTFKCLAQKAFSIILFFVLIIFCFPLPCANGSEKNRWTNVGPSWGGDAFKVVIDPTDSNKLYLVGQTLHKSENGGESWVPIMRTHDGKWNLTVYQLVVNPSDPDILYIGTMGGGIWKSTDGGNVWSPVNETLPEHSRDIRSVVIDKNDPSLIYISLINSNGKLESPVYRSEDGGSNWSPLSEGLPDPYSSATAIYQDPHSGDLFAGIYGEGIYKLSSETGNVWTSMNNGLEDLAKYITYVSFDYQNEGFIYACTHKDWIYRSYDGGNSWQPMNLPYDIVATYPPMAYYLEVDPNNPDSIWVGAAPGSNYQNQTPFYSAEVQQDVGGLFHSSDAGMSWEKILPDFGGFRITIDPSEVIAKAYGHGSKIKYLAYIGGMSVWKSEDSGHSYTVKNQGVTGAWINTFFQDPDDPSTLLAAGQFGMGYTFDGGTSWAHTPTAANKSAFPWFITKDPNRANRYFYALGEPAWTSPENKGLYVLEADNLKPGQKTEFLGQQLPSTKGMGIWKVYYLDSGLMYLATQDNGILKSTDEGNSWIALNNGFEQENVSVACIVFDNNDEPLYAGTRTYNGAPEWLTWPDEKGGLFSWNRDLEKWDQVAADKISKAVFDIQISSEDKNTIFAGTADGLFVSRDGGKSWDNRFIGLPKPLSVSDIEFAPYNPERIFLASFFKGVFVSVDGGKFWTEFNQDLSYHMIPQIAFDSQKENIMFAATLGGGLYSCQTGPAPVIESLKVDSTVIEAPYILSLPEMQKMQINIIASHPWGDEISFKGFWEGRELPLAGDNSGIEEFLNFDPYMGTLHIYPQYGQAGMETEFLLVASNKYFSSTAHLNVVVEEPDEYICAPTINLRLNAAKYSPGDWFVLKGDIANPEAPCKIDFYIIIHSKDGAYEEAFALHKKVIIPHAYEISNVNLLNLPVGNIPAKEFILTGVLVQSGKDVQNKANWMDSDVMHFSITE